MKQVHVARFVIRAAGVALVTALGLLPLAHDVLASGGTPTPSPTTPPPPSECPLCIPCVFPCDPPCEFVEQCDTSDPCVDVQCRAPHLGGGCVYSNVTCSPPEPCEVSYGCVDGECIYEPIECPDQGCEVGSCNPADNSCVYEIDPCCVDACDASCRLTSEKCAADCETVEGCCEFDEDPCDYSCHSIRAKCDAMCENIPGLQECCDDACSEACESTNAKCEYQCEGYSPEENSCCPDGCAPACMSPAAQCENWCYNGNEFSTCCMDPCGNNCDDMAAKCEAECSDTAGHVCCTDPCSAECHSIAAKCYGGCDGFDENNACCTDPCGEDCEETAARCEKGCAHEGEWDCCDDPCSASCTAVSVKCAADCEDVDPDCCEPADPCGPACSMITAKCEAGCEGFDESNACCDGPCGEACNETAAHCENGCPREGEEICCQNPCAAGCNSASMKCAADCENVDPDCCEPADPCDGACQMLTAKCEGGCGIPADICEFSGLIDTLFDDEIWLNELLTSDVCGAEQSGGEGLHIGYGKGEVVTHIPLLTSYAGGGVDHHVSLYYNTLRADELESVGYGWTHSYNLYLKEFPGDGNPVETVVFVDSVGRWNAFTADTPGGDTFETPPGRTGELTRNIDHYELALPDGTTHVFTPQLLIGHSVDRRGRITRFEYDANDRLSYVHSPYGNLVQFAYNPVGQLIQITAPDATITTLAYVGDNLQSVTDPEQHTQQFTYDPQNRVLTETLKNGVVYTAEYDDTATPPNHTLRDLQEEIVVRVACPAGFPRTREDASPPSTIVVTDGRGADWVGERDLLGRTTSLTSPDGGTRKTLFAGEYSGGNRGYAYAGINEAGYGEWLERDAHGNITKRVDATGRNATLYEYNHPTLPALITAETEPDGDQWTFEYAANGDLLRVVNPLYDAASNQHQSFAYTYWPETQPPGDASHPLPGRLATVTITEPNGNVSRLHYSPAGLLMQVVRDPGGLALTTEYEYDDMGRRTIATVRTVSVTLATNWDYDDMGRVTDVWRDPTGENIHQSFEYDEYGNLERHVDGLNTVTTYTYDDRNRLFQRTEDAGTGPDNLNLTTQWSHDGNGNVEHITDHSGGVTSLTYDGANRLIRVVDAEGIETIIDVDVTGDTRGVYRSRSATGVGAPYAATTYLRDPLGRITQTTVPTSPADLVTQFEYVAGAAGCSCSATPGTGLPRSITDAYGKLTYFEYDDLDRRTRIIRKSGDYAEEDDEDDAVSQVEYDPSGNVTATINAEGERVEFTYDAAGRRTHITAINPAGQNRTTVITYEPGTDRVFSIRTPDGYTVYREYDAANRVIRTYDHRGDLTHLTYDDNDNVVSAVDGENHAWQYEYDAVGRLVRVIDPTEEEPGADRSRTIAYDDVNRRVEVTDRNNHVSRYAYDGIDRLTSMTRAALSGDPVTTTYGYEGPGWLAWMRDHDQNETRYDYDDAGRVTQVTYPDSAGPSDVVTFAYDIGDNEVTRTNQRGVATTLVRDDLHRLIERRRVLGAESEDEFFTYDLVGRLTEARNDQAVIGMTYDALGRPGTTTQTHLNFDGMLINEAFVIGVDYPLPEPPMTDRRLTYPTSNRTVRETWNGRGRLSTLRTDVPYGHGSALTTWDFDLANARTRAVHEINDLPSITSEFAYDDEYRLTSLSHISGSGDRVHREYGYDFVGNRTFARDVLRPDHSEQYTYDHLDRLAGFKRGELDAQNAIPPAARLSDAHKLGQFVPTYDKRGNWTQVESWKDLDGQPGVEQLPTESRGPNGANEYTLINPDISLIPPAPVTPTYDAAGNMLDNPLATNVGSNSFAGQTYIYNLANRLVEVRRTIDDQTLQTYAYDALGRRVVTTDYIDVATGVPLAEVEVTWHLMFGPQTLQEYRVEPVLGVDPSRVEATLEREFVWGESFPEPVTMIDLTDAGIEPAGAPELFTYLTDALGSVVALADDKGEIVEQYVYEPYGQTHIENEEGARRVASAVGNPFMWTSQRYDAPTGLYHFTFRTYSPELGRWLQRDPLGYVDGVNLYEYVSSAPLDFVDPLGLEEVCAEIQAYLDSISDGHEILQNARLAPSEEIPEILLSEFNYGVKLGDRLPTCTDCHNKYITGGLFHAPERHGIEYIYYWNRAQMWGHSIPTIDHAKRHGRENGTKMAVATALFLMGQYLSAIGPLATPNDLDNTPDSAPCVDEPVCPQRQGGSDAEGRVEPGQSGTYGELKDRKKTCGESEALDMDHRPSYAAQKKAKEDQLGRMLEPAEEQDLKNSTPAVATPRRDHQQKSRTYGGRNTPEQIAKDAEDLEKARRLDDEAYGR